MDMLAKDLRQKSRSELTRLLTETQTQLQQVRFKVIGDQSKQVREIRKLKRLVARILTVLNDPKIT